MNYADRSKQNDRRDEQDSHQQMRKTRESRFFSSCYCKNEDSILPFK